MRLPAQIVFRNIGPSEVIREMIEERLQWLERHHGDGRLDSCRVAIERRQARHHHWNQFQVRVSVKVWDGQLIVSDETGEDLTHEDIYMAIRDAFESVQRQLGDHAERHRETRRQESRSEIGLDNDKS